jgi:hypothetical protein
MTPDELVSFVEWETEMARHFNEQMRRLNALLEHPHSNYPSVLAGLHECDHDEHDHANGDNAKSPSGTLG